MIKHRYNSYTEHLERQYGYKIYRVGVDAGFSCPNRKCRRGGCVYCDSLGATAAYLRTSESKYGKTASFEKDIDSLVCLSNMENISQQIERGLSFVKRRYKAEHFALYFQAYSNTFAPVEKLKTVYDNALKGNRWEQIIISTRPDCIDKEKLELIAGYAKQGIKPVIELGLQSGDDAILKAMKRGHDVACFIKAANLVKEFGIELCVHIILGFPGEERVQLDKTISVINSVNPDAIKIHNLNITAGTELYEMYINGLAEAPNVEQHIESVIYLLRRISPDIVIERLLCETPAHRLASPKNFPDKNRFLQMLDARMEELNVCQGDLLITEPLSKL